MQKANTVKHYVLSDFTRLYLFDPRNSLDFIGRHKDWRQKIRKTYARMYYDSDGSYSQIKIGAGFPSENGDIFYLSNDFIHRSLGQLCLRGKLKLKIINPELLKTTRQVLKSSISFDFHVIDNVEIELTGSNPTFIDIINKDKQKYVLYYNTKRCDEPHCVKTKEAIEKSSSFLFLISDKPDLKIYYDSGSDYYVFSEDYERCKPTSLYYLTVRNTLKRIPLIVNNEMSKKLRSQPSSGITPVNQKSSTYSMIQKRKAIEEKQLNKVMSNNKTIALKSVGVSSLRKYILENNGEATLDDIFNNLDFNSRQEVIEALEKMNIKGYRDKDGVIRYSL